MHFARNFNARCIYSNDALKSCIERCVLNRIGYKFHVSVSYFIVGGKLPAEDRLRCRGNGTTTSI